MALFSKHTLLVLAFFLSLFTAVYGQNTTAYNVLETDTVEKPSIGAAVTHDLKYTIKGVVHGFSRPLYWKGKDFAKLGVLIAGTVATATLDQETNSFFERNGDDFPKVVRNVGWYFGSPQNYFIINGGLYGFGLFTKNEKVRKTSVLIISSSITNGFLQSFLKTAVGRGRPGFRDSNTSFDFFSAESGYHSFPSGHTALSVTMAHAIAKQFDNTWTKIGIYSLGAIPPISRLIDDAHWLSDIAFSAALSVIVVDSIDKFLFKSKAYDYNEKHSKKITWNLSLRGNSLGIRGVF